MAAEIITLIPAFFLGFTIGISAALVPGPMMLATISISLKKGWKTGLYVFGGHSIVEATLILLIVLGFASFITHDMLPIISILGGLVMILFGIFLIRKAKEAPTMNIAASANKLDISSGPVLAGILTSALNPVYVIWWLTAGSTIIMQQYMAGIIIIIAFVMGHWLADLGILVSVSSAFSRGKELISHKIHQKLLYMCGGLIIAIGFFFIITCSQLPIP
jgi:threonine/homoserine/homoserine lactone efflux protein